MEALLLPEVPEVQHPEQQTVAAAEPGSTGSRPHSWRSRHTPHKGLHPVDWHSTERIGRCNRSGSRLQAVRALRMKGWRVIERRRNHRRDSGDCSPAVGGCLGRSLLHSHAGAGSL